MTPQEVLLKAADIVERPGGWIQGRFIRDTPDGEAYCARGAILHAAGYVFGGPTFDWEFEASKQAECRLTEFAGESIVAWNDAPERTAEEVAAAMRQAAEA